MSKQKRIGIFLIILVTILTVISWITLPSPVPTKYDVNGEVLKTTPKILALIPPLFFGLFGAVMYWRAGEKATWKHLALSIIGVLIFILLLALNFAAENGL